MGGSGSEPLSGGCRQDISRRLQISEDLPTAGRFSHSYTWHIGVSHFREAAVPHHGGLSVEGLECPPDAAAGLPENERSARQQGGSQGPFVELVSDAALHPFHHILFAKSERLKPTHISKGREMSLHLLKGGVAKNLWTYRKPK